MAEDHEKIKDASPVRERFSKSRGTESFFPNFLLKEWLVGAVFLLALVLWVMFNPVDLGPKANPDDTTFIPVPDWYFLFLYQILKYYPGNYEVLGTFLLPAVAGLLFLLVPWLDISKTRHPYRRPIATSAMVLMTFLTIWLTNEAVVQHNAEVQPGPGTVAPAAATAAGLPVLPKKAASDIHFVDTSMPGYQLFESTCANCHGKSGEGGFGPAVYSIGKYWNATQLKTFIDKGLGGMPPKGMLSNDADVQKVADWLAEQKTE